MAQSVEMEEVFGEGGGPPPSDFYGVAKAIDVLGIYTSWLVALGYVGAADPGCDLTFFASLAIVSESINICLCFCGE